MAWDFNRVSEQFGEDQLRRVIVEINNLICGYSDGDVNRSGQSPELWKKLLAYGRVTDEGIVRALEGNLVTQRDTEGPFVPLTITTMNHLHEGEGAPLDPGELDEVIQRVLSFFGMIDGDGNVVED